VYIDTEGCYKLWPDISGDYVVWQDTRNGLRTMAYNLATNEGYQITPEEAYDDEIRPRISGDMIVCMDNNTRNLNLYWLESNVVTPLNDCVELDNRWAGDFDGNVICWLDQDNNLRWRELWFDMDRQPYGPRLAADSCYRGSTYYADGDDVSFCGTNDSGDVWHRIYVQEQAWWTFEVFADSFDATLSIFDHQGNQVLCTLDGSANVLLAADSDYFVRIAGENGSSGRYGLCTEKIHCSRPAGDINGDCVVDMFDFTMLAGSWLECGLENASICP
jgi:beta propeller repeat protein